MPMVTRRSNRVFLYLFVLVVLLVTLFPFYWIINMSLQTNIELYDTPPHFFPPHPTLENFRSVLFEEQGMMSFYPGRVQHPRRRRCHDGHLHCPGGRHGIRPRAAALALGHPVPFRPHRHPDDPAPRRPDPAVHHLQPVPEARGHAPRPGDRLHGMAAPDLRVDPLRLLPDHPARPGERGAHRRVHPAAGAGPGRHAPVRARASRPPRSTCSSPRPTSSSSR